MGFELWDYALEQELKALDALEKKVNEPSTVTTPPPVERSAETIDSFYARQFDEWAHTPGGGHVMKDLFRMAARYGRRYQRSGRRVSIKLLWEIERDQITEVRTRLRKRGIELEKWDGYRLNDHLHPYAARFIMARRPEWAGMFELRAIKTHETSEE